MTEAATTYTMSADITELKQGILRDSLQQIEGTSEKLKKVLVRSSFALSRLSDSVSRKCCSDGTKQEEE